jgi:hypothetical protein
MKLYGNIKYIHVHSCTDTTQYTVRLVEIILNHAKRTGGYESYFKMCVFISLYIIVILKTLRLI